MTTTVPKAVLDEVEVWIEEMASTETGTPSVPGDPAALVVTALAHYSADFVSSQIAVGDAIDRVAALRWSAKSSALADWDALSAHAVGKQGYRGDAMALLIGIGAALERGESGDGLIKGGVSEYIERARREGADAGDRAAHEQWARRAVDYLSDLASARAAIAREHLLGWNE